MTAVAIFFNVALIHCALRALAGEEPSIRGGLKAAVALLPQILGWALVATTIGIVLNMITDTLKEYLGFLGGLLGGLLEFSWAVITYFVVPVLVTEKVGPITAVKRSASILRAKWGESLAGEARIGLLGVLFFLLSALMFAGGAALVVQQGRDGDGRHRRDPDGRSACLPRITGMVVVVDAEHDLPVRRLPLRHHRPGAGVARPRAGRERVPAEGEEVTTRDINTSESCPALCRASTSWIHSKTWMAGTSPAMTTENSTAQPTARGPPSSRCSSGAGAAVRRDRRAGSSAPA